jgi:RHS repeat-associated protein
LLASGCGGAASSPSPGGYLIYIRDREGSVLAAVDDLGNTVSTATDDAFGLRLSSTGTPVPREFLDQERDEETGYEHFRDRYYDPATAQWISPDPQLLENLDCSGRVQGCNPYAFAGDRPLEWTDAEGREILPYIDAFGRQTLLITAGFYGPDASRGQQLFNESMLQLQGELHVIAVTAVYKSAAEIPEGITRIEADLNHVQNGGTYLGSETNQRTSTAVLSQDALDPGSNAQWAAIIQHETLHLAGLDDSYVQLFDQRLQLNWPPSQKGSPMGLIYDVPGTALTSKDLADLANPPAAANQGLTLSPAGFGGGQDVETVDTYGP